MNEQSVHSSDEVYSKQTIPPRPARLPKLPTVSYTEPSKPPALAPRVALDTRVKSALPATTSTTNSDPAHPQSFSIPGNPEDQGSAGSKPPASKDVGHVESKKRHHSAQSSDDGTNSRVTEGNSHGTAKLTSVIRDAAAADVGASGPSTADGQLPHQVTNPGEPSSQDLAGSSPSSSLDSFSATSPTKTKTKSRLAQVSYAHYPPGGVFPTSAPITPQTTEDALPDPALAVTGSSIAPSDFSMTQRHNLLVHVTTYNMCSKLPPTVPESLLGLDKQTADIYIVGTQESGLILEWEQLLNQTLGKRYVKAASQTLMAIHVVMFVKASLRQRLTNVRYSSVATGVGNVLGNKGAVAISFQVDRVKILCICCHFAAHDAEVDRRNSDYKRVKNSLFVSSPSSATLSPASTVASLINVWTSHNKPIPRVDANASDCPTPSSSPLASSSGMNPSLRPSPLDIPNLDASLRSDPSPSPSSTPSTVPTAFSFDEHDIILWMGDMNYRINGNPSAIMHLIDKKMYEVLHANDQLRIQQRKGRIFKHFQEHPIHFAPTFKYEIGTSQYNLKRVPSWTDRVLYRVNPKAQCSLRPLYYDSIDEVKASDHRPVVAGFDLLLSQPPSPTQATSHKRFLCAIC